MKKRKIAILLSCFMIFSSSTANAFAYYPSEYAYYHNSTTYFQTRDWTHETKNPTSIVQPTDYSVSRAVSASFNVTYSETINAMIAEVGVSLEVSIGTSETRTESKTYYVPEHSRYTLVWGTQFVSATGYRQYYVNNQLQSNTYVSGRWSYQSYDDMEYLGPYYN